MSKTKTKKAEAHSRTPSAFDVSGFAGVIGRRVQREFADATEGGECDSIVLALDRAAQKMGVGGNGCFCPACMQAFRTALDRLEASWLAEHGAEYRARAGMRAH